MDNSTVQMYVDQTCTNLILHEFKTCQISHSDLSHQHIPQLRTALLSAPRLRKLDITNCPNLQSDSITELCCALAVSNVSHLSFESVMLGTTGLVSVTRLLEQRSQHNNNIRSDDYRQTTGSRLNKCRIKSLSLDGSMDLARIDINVWNEFVSVACRTLHSLDVSRINLCDVDYIVSLSNAISNHNNTNQHQRGTTDDVDGTDCHLLALILSNNPMGDDGLEILCQALKHNRTLILLSCGECNITSYSRGVHALTDCVVSNPTLQRLYLYGNPISNATNHGTTTTNGSAAITGWTFLDGPESSELLYWLELNRLGRNLLQQQERHNYCLRGLLPFILARVSNQNMFLYGLLREAPHWLMISS
jgi:hypothetical protein